MKIQSSPNMLLLMNVLPNKMIHDNLIENKQLQKYNIKSTKLYSKEM